MVNWVTTWRLECDHLAFPRTYNLFNFLVEFSTYKQVIKLTFRRDKFGKKTVQNLQTRMHFYKTLGNQVDKIIDQLHLSKSIPNKSFKFISCQETYK